MVGEESWPVKINRKLVLSKKISSSSLEYVKTKDSACKYGEGGSQQLALSFVYLL